MGQHLQMDLAAFAEEAFGCSLLASGTGPCFAVGSLHPFIAEDSRRPSTFAEHQCRNCFTNALVSPLVMAFQFHITITITIVLTSLAITSFIITAITTIIDRF